MFKNTNKKASAYLVQSASLFVFPYFMLPVRALPKKRRPRQQSALGHKSRPEMGEKGDVLSSVLFQDTPM